MVIVNSIDHEHAVTLDDAFDFINTLELENGAPVDHLVDPATAVAWLVDHRLVHPEVVADPATHNEAALERVRTVRAALREVSDALAERRPARADAVEEINRLLREGELVRLEPSDNGVRIGHGHTGNAIDEALARLAGAIVHEVAEGHPDRLRVCANDRCRWVFYDASPTARRRWCSMASCGNRAKAARHRARARQFKVAD